MLADKSVMASSRWSAACKTRENDAFSQGVHIMERYGDQGRSRVEWRCIVVLCGDVVVAYASSSLMVTIVFGVVVVVNRVIITSSSSTMCIVGVSINIGVGFLSGLGFVMLVVGGMQRVQEGCCMLEG